MVNAGIDWTQVLLAVVTTVGTVLTVWLTSRAKMHAAEASKSAFQAVQASLRPGPASRYPGLPSNPVPNVAFQRQGESDANELEMQTRSTPPDGSQAVKDK